MIKRATFLLFIILPFSLCFDGTALADDETSSGIFFPQTRLYPSYIANPLRYTFGVQNMRFSKTDIVDTSERRYDLKVGANLGVYRNQPETLKRGWQVSVGGGFHGQFDPASYEDNVGWDGIISVSLELRHSEALAHRFGIHHISSHVGDELIERTGIVRKNYTRQEIRYGLMWFMLPHWQSYFELGQAYDLRNKHIQKLWRSELGVQYENEKYWRTDFGWYMAADFSGYEENNWAINTSLHLGILSKVADRSYRIGFELYEGRSTLGEFFLNKEKSISFGIWVDI